LKEQVKNNRYNANYDNTMNLAQAMLVGRSLEAFLNEKISQGAKNKVRKAKTQTENTQIIAQMAGKMPSKSNEEKIKNNDRNRHNSNGGRISTRQGNTSRGGRRGRGRGRGGRGGKGNNSEHLKNVECLNCGKKGHYSTDCSLPIKNDNVPYAPCYS
jgi:hypothetical protein